MQARGAASARKPAEPVPSAYDIIWQVGEPMLPDQAMATPTKTHRLTWQSDAGGQHPQRMRIGRMRTSAGGREVHPAREALRSVAWLQAAVRGSRPGSAIRLRTRGVLSFPQLQDSSCGFHWSSSAKFGIVQNTSNLSSSMRESKT